MREKEWAIHEEMITAGRAAMDRWRDSDKVPNLIEIAKVFELACRLGRMAAGLPLSYTEVSGKVESPIRIDIEAALQRAYGSAADADVESIPVVEEVREGPSSAVLDEGRAEKSIPFVEDVGEGTMAHCYRSSQPAKETGSNSSPSGSSNDAIGGCCV